MAYDYTCLQYQDSCATFTSDANCSEVGTKTCTKDENGTSMTWNMPGLGECSSYTRNFVCKSPKPGEGITQTTSCDLLSTQAGLNWSTTTESSAADFVQAATSQEMARQLATYGASDADGFGNLFAGKEQKCRDGYFGLKSCCKSSGGGGVTNNSLAKEIGTTVAMAGFKYGASYAVSQGSQLVYDSIMSNAPELMTAGLKSTLDAGIASAGSGIGAFGFGTSASAAGGVFGASSSVAIGNTGLYFNPYALALAVAIQVVMQAMECDQSEFDLANARGKNLCVATGSYCSKKSAFGCMETSQSFCCYNSLLAKGIQQSAHKQLNLSWGQPKSPDCRGLSPQQLTSLDFGDPSMEEALAPFKDQLLSNYNKGAGAAIGAGSVQSDISSKTGATSKALCLQRQKLDPSTVCQ